MLVQLVRLAPSNGLNKLGLSHPLHLSMEIKPVSETLCSETQQFRVTK
jgi:hypothetical protein